MMTRSSSAGIITMARFGWGLIINRVRRKVKTSIVIYLVVYKI